MTRWAGKQGQFPFSVGGGLLCPHLTDVEGAFLEALDSSKAEQSLFSRVGGGFRWYAPGEALQWNEEIVAAVVGGRRMHELSIAMGIIDAASEEADRRGGVEVVSIHVRLGALSGVVKEALESAFELAREGSPMAESRLVIEEAAVAVLCPVCRAERPVRSIQCMCCSECGTPTADIVRGRELEITALEIVQ